MDDVKKKFTMIGLGVVLLAAIVMGAVIVMKVFTGSNEPAHDESISTTNKAVDSLCQHTDYQKSCHKSLANANDTSDPKELVKLVFNSAIKEVQMAMDNSTTLKELAKDPRASMALDQCKEVLNKSIDDLNRSFKKLDNFDAAKMEEYVDDLKTWLSGSLTYQETCREGFKNTSGEAGEKMKQLLNLGWKLTSNGLAMVNVVGELLGEVQLTGTNRRLLDKGPNDDAWWVKDERRVLLNVDPKKLKPNAVVAKDGSGKFKTIMDAVRSVPAKNAQPFVILIKQGIYKESVDVPRRVDNVIFIGEGPTKTRITGNIGYNDGITTYKTATVAVNGDNFMAKDIGFENTAGPQKHQAVALRVSSDMAIFHNCAMDGYQDTLYAHSYRQFYRQCTITGTIDFIFGDAAAVFQDCKMIVRKPLDNQACMVTAQGRKDRNSKGILVLDGCKILAEPAYMATNPLPKSYLGRPWKEYSRTIIMQSFIDKHIAPEGWSPWAGTFGLDTCYYGELNNKGPGANTAQRVKWKGIKKISPQEASKYTPGKYMLGDLWIKATGVPYEPDMMKV
ncbi:pectinesterase-like [Rutidosis leptorrhynchoides]|uniref:pectinesterase-like n=1 Tax=Rutidosis leptorrhynchoides TaxID=125765 RepID=UPI003A98F498